MFHILLEKFSCVVTAPVKGEATNYLQTAIDEGYQIIYILTENGDKYVRRAFGKDAEGNQCYGQFKVKEIPGFKLGTVTEELNFLPQGKIPYMLLWEVEKFFKAVIAKFGDKELEAMIWIMWNAERGYFLHVPTQTVAGAAVTYDWANLPMTSDGKPSRIIVDIHSHANFGAFFSGTDDRDDSNTIRYSGVLGYNRRPNPMMVFRFNFMETKKPVEVSDLFDIPRTEVQETPTDWLEKVKVTTYGGGNYQSSSYGGYTGYGGNPHSGGRYGNWKHNPSKYKAPKPSNATIQGFIGGEDVWYLRGGGYITMEDWDIEYAAILAEDEKKEREKKLADEQAKVGGQQGTSPLELMDRETGPESDKSLVFPKVQSPENSQSQKPDWSESDSSSSVTRFPSNPFPISSPAHKALEQRPLRTQPVLSPEFQVGPGGQTPTTSNSQSPLINQSQSLTTPSQSTLKLSDTENSAQTGTTSEGTDPLAVFTKNRSAYVSEVVDGQTVLVQLGSDQDDDETSLALDALHSTWRQELRESQEALTKPSQGAVTEVSTDGSGKVAEGVIPVEIPTLVKTTPKAGSSEVNPLGSTFCPTPETTPTLQPRQAVSGNRPQVPTLMHKASPANRWMRDPVPLAAEQRGQQSVDEWLAQRQQKLQRERGLGFPVEDVPSIPETRIDRMHERSRQEALLSDAEELAELQGGMSILYSTETASGSISVLPDDTIVLRLEKGDIPPTFDLDCIDYGKRAAGAKAIIDVAVDEISANGALMRKTVQNLFELVDSDEQLPLFKTLLHSLPPKARESLETNGF